MHFTFVRILLSAAASVGAVLVADVRHVSKDLPGAQFVETTLAAHPRNPQNLVAAAMVLHGNSTSVVVYATQDGGRTWAPGRWPHDDNSRSEALDPWVIFTSEGTALFTYLSRRGPNNFAVSRSHDGGLTWSAPAFVPGGLYDRQFLVEDASPASQYRGRIYGLGKINLSRLGGPAFQAIAVSDSTDGGQTFSPPRLFVPPDDNDPLWIVAGGAVTQTGKLVVPFATVIRPKDTDATLHYTLWTTESNDGGHVFSAPRLVAPRVVPRGQVQKYISVPSVAIRRSDESSGGRIYLAWSVFQNEGYVIQLWRSQDDGHTWLPGVTVSDNLRPAGHVNPAVAVNARGDVAVAWYDRREHSESTCHRLFAAASTDGGATFSNNVAVTQDKTCIGSRRFANGGDTLGIAADASGRFHAAFISGADSSAMQLYTAQFAAQPRPGARALR